MWSQGADREPICLPGVTICMAIEPTKPEVISTVKARGGVTGNKVRYVLGISLLLAVAAMIFVYLGVPGGLMDGATSAPGKN
ncbi:hypothetical protein [Sandarakinorhabdus limnophila]|uniref:hypothetical protein n=1 Tax=Sandarakinorhabdus limnophila TaxID=210512 RepID=UPI00313789B3